MLKKLLLKLIMMLVMVGVVGGLMRFAKPYIMKSAGVPEGMPGVEGIESAHFSSEESDLMGTIFKSAVRLFTGQAKRDELAGELNAKLYGGRSGTSNMAELGIEMEKPAGNSASPPGMGKPGGNASVPAGGSQLAPGAAAPARDPNTVAAQPGAKLPTKAGARPVDAKVKTAADKMREALFGRVFDKMKANPELSLVPVVVFGMLLWHIFRRRRSPEDDFVVPDMSQLMPSESEAYDMKHAVHALGAEDFEMLVALIYQRQGYQVTMPSALSGGRGGDFIARRKSEKLLIQCKKLSQDHKVPIDRVKELQEVAATAGVTRGVYAASCSFSWDARNFAKANGVTVINTRMLDTLITQAQEKPDEDILAVAQ
ncbi:MAG: restriction endonuclease, partial [Chthoniobacterales bacterium]